MDRNKETPFLARFFDAFLQERNIKWMLALGVFIFLASSMSLIAPAWAGASPTWRCVVFFGYTVAAFLAGEWTYHRLGLRKTGTVFLGLTVLLVPILFLAVGRTIDGSHLIVELPLLSAVAGFAALAGHRIFRHFLRETQPTFLASYLLLAASGAVLPLLASVPVVPVGLVLWAIFAVGATKATRHIFWLAEEHRQPRIFGFFPIALLGLQFLSLFVLHVAPSLELEGLGVACVLVAIPILTTADAIARVFQQRTGDLVRPLPWSIVAPLGVGLLLIAVGLGLTAPGFVPPKLPHAMFLAASLSTGLLGLVARRTGKEAIVWAGLATLTMAYQAAPAFFIDFVRTIRDQGALLVHEERLPFAFYGLTYLPLLIGLSAFGARRSAAGDLFVRPARQFAMGLVLLLLGLSATHAKAVFPVGLALTAVVSLQLVLFRWQPLVYGALSAYVFAAIGLEAFLRDVVGLDLPVDFTLYALTAAASALFLIGCLVDRWLEKLPSPAAIPNLICNTSFAASWILAGCWFGRGATMPGTMPPATVWLLAALVVPMAFAEIVEACRRQSEFRAWHAVALLSLAVAYLLYFRVLIVGGGLSMFLLMGLAIVLWTIREIAGRHERMAVLIRPLETLAHVLPGVVVSMGIARHFLMVESAWRGSSSLAMLLAGAFYFWRGIETRHRGCLTLAFVVLNIAFALLWRELAWTDPQFFLIPIGLTVLALVQLFREELPDRLHDPLRYLGALVILVSPVFHIVDGSWIHLFTLMVASVVVAFLGIGLRVRALVYAGTAFLLADLVAMLVRGSIDHPQLLWLAGLSLGAGVLALAAYCERNREVLVQRMRLIAETLQEWQ